MSKFTRIYLSLWLWSLCSSLAAQETPWENSYSAGYKDTNGNFAGGTEIMNLIAHKGKLYAGNSYWMESDPSLEPSCEILTLTHPDSAWRVDKDFGPDNQRLNTMASLVFRQDSAGNAITPDTLLVAVPTTKTGEVFVWVRNDTAHTWEKVYLRQGAQPRSLTTYYDSLNREQLIYVGLKNTGIVPGGVFKGWYDPSVAGKLVFDSIPELETPLDGRVMGFAECNGKLYAASESTDGFNDWGEIYERDNASREWNLVYRSEIGGETEDLRGLTSIPNPEGAGEVLLFSWRSKVRRLNPLEGYRETIEAEVKDTLEKALGEPINWVLSAYNRFEPITDPTTGETIWLMGFESRLLEPSTRWANIDRLLVDGMYFIRRQRAGEISYEFKQIYQNDPQNITDLLVASRTFAASPFVGEEDILYAGGYDANSKPANLTAWIYKGRIQERPEVETNYTLYSNIDYVNENQQAKLQLDLYVPSQGNQPKPVMVYVHGGSWRTGDKSNTGSKDQFFTEQGYIFVSVNYRLSPNPIDLNDPDRIIFPTHPQDVAKAVAWVIKNIEAYGGDAGQVSLIGHSAGAHLVSLISTDESYLQQEGIDLSQIQCVCSLDAGAHDIPYYLNRYVIEGSGQWNNYVNAFTDDPDVWEAASPITYVSPDKDIPDFMLVYQGSAQRVDLHRNFGEALAAAQVPVTYYNAQPWSHTEINQAVGADLPETQVYNDSLLYFFSDCLQNRSLPTRTETFDSRDFMQITPNPTSGQVTLQLDESIRLEELTLRVFSMQGKPLREFSFKDHRVSVDLSRVPPGTYLVKIIYQHQTTWQRILKL